MLKQPSNRKQLIAGAKQKYEHQLGERYDTNRKKLKLND